MVTRVRVLDRSRIDLREVYRAWKLQKRVRSPGARQHWLDALANARGQASGIMRRMTDPETKPPTPPKLPWYRGRRLRRRILILLAVLTLPWSIQLIFADPRRLAAKLGLYTLPPTAEQCQRARDCKGTCAFGRPFCLRHGAGSDPKDPLGGACMCRSREEEAARHIPLPTCRNPVLIADDGDALEWKCMGGVDPPDGGDGGP